MAALDDFCSVVRDYSSVADFIIIYILEAHPIDEWSIMGTEYSTMKQHKSFEQRVDAAKVLEKKNIPCPIYVDKFDNEAAFKYAGVPERLYVIHERVVRYVGCAGSPGPKDFRPAEVREWLGEYVASRK
ncbi:hypothetical protein FSP39_017648 [Pinctada imbricata]|uniref:Iodothyronine deiodinase n=1 Tax=Pinctada imbricata TaxID=66713 RepID=A0AA88Y4F3_PINIB|nr:hypothetical protein FSP39_017648 [Pinctada imbricata]